MDIELNNKFIIYNIQYEYKFLSRFLIFLQIHINNLYDNYLISLYERNIFIGKIYENIKSLNSFYNKLIVDDNNVEYNFENYEELNDNIKSFYNYRNFLINLKEVNNSYYSLLYPLDNIRNQIIDLSKKYANKNILLVLELILKNDLSNLYNEKTIMLINFLNNIYIPIKFDLINKEFNNKIEINSENEGFDINSSDDFSYTISDFEENFIDYFKELKIYIKKENNDELLNKVVCIELYFSNKKTIYFEGVFYIDSINILLKTCQISNKFLYYKKKYLENFFKNTKATKKFFKSFFKSLTTYEILSYDKNNFIDFIDENYDKYMSLISKSFMNIMKDFIKKNNTLTSMFTTIRLLLLGNEENVNVAGLLFEITKDKKINSNLMYNVIYKNLNYVSQIKLKKTSTTMKEELKKIKSITIDDVDLKKQILSLKQMPIDVKALAFEKIEEMKSSNNEYYKQLMYVKTLIKFPWPSESDNYIFEELNKNFKKRKEYITNIEKKLTNLTYGHKEAKESLIQTIGKWISNPKSGGNVISLVGPPGVGKTLLARSISNALDIPFAQITLGGQNDGELLHGHGYTYSGSQPGMIVKKMIEAKKNRCILYFDELDKACSKSGKANEISSILIHLTDPNMNTSFQDRFFQGIDFPLNNVIMIFSYNDSNLIDPILLDRFKEIKIKPYSLKDKVNIVKNFTLKEICNSIGFTEKIILKDETIKYIVENYTLEAGIRNLKRKLENILLHLNVDRLYQRNLFKKKKKQITIDKNLVTNILKNNTIQITKIHPKSEIGIINGLYATSIGSGGIVPIQIFSNFNPNSNSFSLRLTGSQGDVMKESVQCSLTCALNYINSKKEKFKIKDINDIIKKYPNGFHIHAPAGATPKDGPSAGGAFTTAFISRLLDKEIYNDIAMTGEIDLVGNILEIGGLNYKLQGALKAGVKKVLIPEGNKKDFEDIKKNNPNLVKKLEIVIIKNIDEIVDHAIKI